MKGSEHKTVMVKISAGLTGILLLNFFENASNPTQWLLFLPFYLLLSKKVFQKTWRDWKEKRFLREHFLMATATLGAAFLGEWCESLAVLLFYTVGEFLEEKATDRSQKSVSALLSLQSHSARVWKEGVEKEVPAQSVEIGSVLIIYPFEKIPLDAVVLEGESDVDASSLTGEAAPVFVKAGDVLLAGSINGEKTLTAKVLRPFEESSVAKILKWVRDSREKKAQMEKWMARFAKIYTPTVVGMAIFIALLPLFWGGDWEKSFFRALVLLVISCPCAFMIGVPLVYFCAIGKASKEGILIKGGVFVDVLAKAKKIILDKTGTLTTGHFALQKAALFENAPENQGEKLIWSALEKAAWAENGLNHPIAKSLVRFYKARCGENLPLFKKNELRGKGVFLADENILVGSKSFLKERGVEMNENDAQIFQYKKGAWHKMEKELAENFNVFLAQNNKILAAFLCADALKESAPSFFQFLKEKGIKSAILSGDDFKHVESSAKLLTVEEYYGNLLPEEKAQVFQNIKGKECAIFVGDGVNDAPVLALADAGVSWGRASAAALENADVVLMNDSFFTLQNALVLAKKAQGILWFNVVLALGVKFAALFLGVWGSLTMWFAIFADTGVTFIVVLNALRIFKMPLPTFPR